MTTKFAVYITAVSKLESILSTLSANQLSFKMADDKWSVNEVVAHLVDTEIQVYTRFRSILADDVPYLSNHNEAKWAPVFKHNAMNAKESLATFKLIRNLNYRLIESLDDAQLKMEGLHSTRGKMTVATLIKGHIVHLENHINQISKNLAEYGKSRGRE